MVSRSRLSVVYGEHMGEHRKYRTWACEHYNYRLSIKGEAKAKGQKKPHIFLKIVVYPATVMNILANALHIETNQL